MKPRKKPQRARLAALSVLLTATALVCGCSNLFLPGERVVPVQVQATPTAAIKSMRLCQPGRVMSLTPDGTALLCTGQNNAQHTIDRYQVADDKLVNLVVSDAPISDVQAVEDGFFYTRGGEQAEQLVWSSEDKSSEHTITERSEDINSCFYAYGKNACVYVSGGSQLVFNDSDGQKRVYALSRTLRPLKIVWSPSEQTGFIISEENAGRRLYQLILTGERLSCDLLMKNVIDIAFSAKTQKLAVIAQDDESCRLYELSDIRSMNVRAKTRAENLAFVRYAPDGEGLYLGQQNADATRTALLYCAVKDNTLTQLCSPLVGLSGVIPAGGADSVYFSLPGEAGPKTAYAIYHLVYRL